MLKQIKKLSIVIPVYNEKETILKIVDHVKAVPLKKIKKEIILVDDCSTDGTTELLKKMHKKDKNLVVKYKSTNEGKGFALRDGFKEATGDYVIVQDADLEYDPMDYIDLLENLSDEYRVVYGSRFSGDYQDMTTLHYLGNKMLTLITNLLFDVTLTDMETCYKLLPGDFARNLDITAARFNFEPEVTAKILRVGHKIKEVPISYKGRSHSDGKKITWRDGISAVITLVKFRFFA